MRPTPPLLIPVLAAVNTDSLRKLAVTTGICRNRLHRLRHRPGAATLAELRQLANAGLLRLIVLPPAP